MNLYSELKDFGYLIMWAIVGLTIMAWVIHELKETAFQSGYWKGRKDGWDMYRRMVETKRKSDEVFDYDKQN